MVELLHDESFATPSSGGNTVPAQILGRGETRLGAGDGGREGLGQTGKAGGGGGGREALHDLWQASKIKARARASTTRRCALRGGRRGLVGRQWHGQEIRNTR